MPYTTVREGSTVLFKLYINFSLQDFGQLNNFHLSCASSPFPPHDQKIDCISDCEHTSMNLILKSLLFSRLNNIEQYRIWAKENFRNQYGEVLMLSLVTNYFSFLNVC